MGGEAYVASAATKRRLCTGALLLCALPLMMACSSERTGTADSSLLRDLQLVSQLANQPTFQDTALSDTPARQEVRASKRPAANPGPARSIARPRSSPPVQIARAPEPEPQPERTIPAAAAPAPAPAAAPSREIAAGTGISMTAGGRVCTLTGRPGDKIVATVDAPITGTNGATIPAGSKVVLEVASVAPGDPPEQGRLIFRVRALYVGDSLYQAEGDVTPTSPLEKVKVAGNPNADRKKVIGGAIAGAILGQVLGRDTKSTVIGAATGAAAGTMAAKAGERYEGCLNPGSSLTLTLAQSMAM